jgi:hypothetical protein
VKRAMKYLALAAALCGNAWLSSTCAAQPDFKLDTIRGRVVYLAEAFEKRTGIPTVAEAKDRILALQTAKGDLIPLFEDVRGRAFRRVSPRRPPAEHGSGAARPSSRGLSRCANHSRL